MNKIIPVYKPWLNGNEKLYVNQCLDSSWISSKGEFIERFEKEFCCYTKSNYATTVTNGTVALHLGLKALNIGIGDEVIVPTLTYIASINTIIQSGATPIFVDSLEHTLQMDSNDILRKITPKTKAIMVVHLYGLPCDMATITVICKENNLLMIEDCAEAFGSYYRGKHVGTFGDIGTFSFFGNKTITTGEGGMVISQNKAIIERAKHLKAQGVSKEIEYWHDEKAYNYRMTNICAAIGLAQLERADEIIRNKKKIADWYRENLTSLPLRFHDEIPGTTHSFWMCTIILDSEQDRDSLRKYLQGSDIETRPLFPPAHTLPYIKTNQHFTVAESLSKRGVNLPSYPELLEEDVINICDYIRQFLKNKKY
ncbi:UDP-4-amino-4-deoxy-L-arabinose--oxoglutarate aminotransferase (plasmid) [Rickettsiales bacterium Ac37b]|nr:UDP-4-amino-4-deoxy-L-arabinose--oxoglutarate aminotransferase [Rickettsiales bacterium Ac37b]